MNCDYIIVGQGISGSCLAYEILKRKRSLVVFDTPDKNISSTVAPGVFNPVTGKNLVLTWKAELLFNYLHSFYDEVGSQLHRRILCPKNIYRPFLNVYEQNDWMGKSSDAKYRPFIQDIRPAGYYQEFVNDPLGGIELKNSGFIDVNAFLNGIQKLLVKNGAYRKMPLDFDEIKINNGQINYQGIRCRHFIFADGPSGSHNPYFKKLPFSLVKGELLTIETESRIPIIFNRGAFIQPLEDNICHAGATYELNTATVEPTEKALSKLTDKIDNLLKVKYKILDQAAGIRPATRDRRPFIGKHPNYQGIYLFNGLGTKGVSLAPFFSNQMINFIENGKELDREVDIKRYIF